ncbi:MAG: hypothetical protein QOG50_2535 [Actinomycetota bacterium]|jgi:hypothetical protein|nr:hypothetical protein [Actinomycetota bacterium]
MTTPPPTVGSLAELVRSKNAGPFWQTIDIFFSTDENYRAVAENPSLDANTIARLYRVAPDTIRIYRLPDIRVVKVSFPRPTKQGGIHDRDMHAGQQHIPMSQLVLHQPEH